MRWSAIPILAMLFGSALAAAEPVDVAPSLKIIGAIGREGAGNAEAAKAWAELVKAGPEALFPILNAIADDKPTGANWLRTAVDAIAEKHAATGGKFDAEKLTEFVVERKGSPTARAVAYGLLRKEDAGKALELLPSFLDDPSVELRREAVQHLLVKETTLNRLPQIPTLQRLFIAARDKDQVEAIAKELKNQKQTADITKHFGYITQWSVSGEFDNKDGVGFQKAYPPETAAERQGWKAAQSSAVYGEVDLNKVVGKKMNAVGYAAALLVADADTPAEIRVASPNAVKIFVNGKEIFGRDAYHHGTAMDQHLAKVQLIKGKNTILLKVCQNDMPYDWAQTWGFAARICDSTGGSLKLKQLVDDKPVSLGELAPAEPKEPK